MISKKEKNILNEISQISFSSANSLYNLLKNKINPDENQITIDNYGNINFHKKGNGKKIQVIFRIAPQLAIIGAKKESKINLEITGGVKLEDWNHQLVYNHNNLFGVLRNDKEKQLYLDDFKENSCENTHILTFENRLLCKADSLYSINLSSIILCDIAVSLFNSIKNSVNDIYFTLSNTSLSGEGSVAASLKSINPDVTFLISPISSQEKCLTDNSPAVVVKDGGYILVPELRNKFLFDNKEIQTFIGNNDKTLEQLSVTGKSSVFGVYLPIDGFKTPIEKINWLDVEKTRNLLLKTIV